MDQIPISSSGGGGGNSWSPALRRRLGLPSTTYSSESKEKSSNDELSADVLPITTQSSSTTSTLSSHELRRYIHKTYSTLTSIQCQLHRGEESYFEQSYSHGNLLQGWDNIWIEQHHNHSNSSYTNSSGGGMYSSSGIGEDGSSSNVSNNNYAHHNMNNHNKSIPIRKMPAEYRWFTSSCGTNLPITSTDNNSSSSGIDRVAALERWSLIDRPPTPEAQEEKQVAKQEDVDNSLMKKKDANVAVTLITDINVKRDIDGRSNNNDNTATQSTKEEVAVIIKVESTSTTANKSQVNGKEADTAAERTMDIDPIHQPKKDEPTDKSSSSFQVVVKEAENQSNKGQASKVADTEPQSRHTLSSGQSSTDTEMVIETTTSSTLESKMKKDETNDTTKKLHNVSSSCNIQPSSSATSSSSSPTAAAAADDKYQTNTATIQSKKQIESTSSNGKSSTDNTRITTMDHPKNSIANKDSSEMTGHTIDGKGMTREQDSSTSVSLPQSKRARLDTNQLSKDSTADDDTASSNADMNTNLSREHDDDHETNIKVQQSEPIEEEEEEKVETVPTSSTAVIDGSRASSSRRSTRKRKTS